MNMKSEGQHLSCILWFIQNFEIVIQDGGGRHVEFFNKA